MTSASHITPGAVPSPAHVSGAAPTRREGYLFGPVMDFLCLGGGSLIVLAVMAVTVEPAMARYVIPVTGVLAVFVNYPHFAHSYQLFYRDYRNKAFGWTTPAALRARYLFAGLGVPALLLAFFAVAISLRDPVLLGQGINIMAFFAGWHYTKQGYGMLIVDSVLKKNFFDEQEKKVLMVNSYAAWIALWTWGNHTVRARDLWGLEAYTFGIPVAVAIAAIAFAVLTFVGSVVAIARRRRVRSGRPFPLSGLFGYIAGVYVWLPSGFINPVLMLVVPFFHSLQYQIVVWRYELNRETARQPDGSDPGRRAPRWDTPKLRFGLFCLLGVIFGAIGFLALPQYLDTMVAYDKALFGGTMFLFLCWIFINIHHYFMDNVIWRRDNPEVARHLFAAH